MEATRSLPADSLRLLVFDLDGTLIDSRLDLCNSVNAMLTHFGRHPLPDAVIASYIGDGAAMLVRRSLGDPEDSAFVEQALRYFLGFYREHKLDHTYVYPGVHEALAAVGVAADGSRRQMAVLTNKPVGPAVAICAALGLAPHFFRIYGGDSFAVKKPDSLGLETLIAEAGVTPEETVMIGDTDVDVLTARACGAWALGCGFGLAPHTLESAPPDCLVHSPAEWTRVLAARH
jgi:phosphoglycolate phosphatase